MSLSNFLHENIHATYAPLLYVPWLISTYKYTDLKGFIFFCYLRVLYIPTCILINPTPTPPLQCLPPPHTTFYYKNKIMGLENVG